MDRRRFLLTSLAGALVAPLDVKAIGTIGGDARRLDVVRIAGRGRR
jgi:hypothetical protein